jgi:hypothetical protein
LLWIARESREDILPYPRGGLQLKKSVSQGCAVTNEFFKILTCAPDNDNI